MSVNINQQPDNINPTLSPKKAQDGGGEDTGKSKHDNNLRGKYTVEKEDDFGQQQQVSGAFGDSSNADEQTILLIMQ